MGGGRERRERPGVSRRGFITSMGAGVVGTAALGARPAEAAPASAVAAGETVTLALTVNGLPRRVAVEPRMTLLEVLRGPLGLTGAKPGCERGECGACTVLVGGQPRYACMMLALEAEGADVTTVEGLLDGETLGPVQQAFVEKDGFQCGFCTSGQVIAVEGLLRKRKDPTPEEIREGLSGNLCRCGAYAHIFEAARRAGELKRGGGR
jgi:xanthine dehydrogenase YagT iron-sulfur-binding subunit